MVNKLRRHLKRQGIVSMLPEFLFSMWSILYKSLYTSTPNYRISSVNIIGIRLFDVPPKHHVDNINI